LPRGFSQRGENCRRYFCIRRFAVISKRGSGERTKAGQEMRMLRWVSFGVVAALMSLTSGGCSSFSFYKSADKTIIGNNTGGIVPQAVTSEQEQVAAAQAHCAQYNSQMRVTSRPAEAGGRLVFVCEPPGTPPPPGSAAAMSDEPPPGVRTKKKQNQ
jgi:hypothetical protein